MLRRHHQIRMQIHQLLDVSLLVIALWLAHAWRSHWKLRVWGGAAEIGPFEDFIWLYLIIVPLSPLVLKAHGLYSRALSGSRRMLVWPLLRGCALITLSVIFAIFLMRGQHLIARSVVILFGFLSFILIWGKEECVRLGLRSRFGQAQFRKRLLLVGSPEDTERLRRELRDQSPEGVDVLESMDLNRTSVEGLVRSVHEHSANGVILCARHTYFGQVEQAIQACELEGVEVWLVADFFKTRISQTSVDDFCGRPVLVFRSAPETSWQALAKQVIDLVGGVALVVVTLPLMAVVALLIRLTSPGPVLFRQERSGLNGQPFVMYKFRTMVSEAEQLRQELEALNEMDGPVFKMTADPRVTGVGRWLRRYSIDELPQLYNVLRGEMSLVGPRPLPVAEVARFDDLAHRRRLSVKPGLTCLWQISGRNDVSDFRDWVRLDLEYIDTWSVWLDLKILCRTVPAVLMARGAK